jgi:hypothetical protein
VNRIQPLHALPERRRRRRQAFDIPGELLDAGGRLTPCRIVNLDASGAQVMLDGARLLPTRLTLTLRLQSATVTYGATILWRRGNRVGLELADRREQG